MIRLHASFKKTVPAEQQFSSRSAGASIEVELADGTPEEIKTRLKALWSSLKSSVEEELNGGGNGHAKVSTPSNGNGNGSQPDIGTSNVVMDDVSGPASSKQIGFLLSCARRAKGMNPSQAAGWLKQLYNRSLNELSKKQASEAIDTLKKS